MYVDLLVKCIVQSTGNRKRRKRIPRLNREGVIVHSRPTPFSYSKDSTADTQEKKPATISQPLPSEKSEPLHTQKRTQSDDQTNKRNKTENENESKKNSTTNSTAYLDTSLIDNLQTDLLDKLEEEVSQGFFTSSVINTSSRKNSFLEDYNDVYFNQHMIGNETPIKKNSIDNTYPTRSGLSSTKNMVGDQTKSHLNDYDPNHSLTDSLLLIDQPHSNHDMAYPSNEPSRKNSIDDYYDVDGNDLSKLNLVYLLFFL